MSRNELLLFGGGLLLGFCITLPINLLLVQHFGIYGIQTSVPIGMLGGAIGVFTMIQIGLRKKWLDW